MWKHVVSARYAKTDTDTRGYYEDCEFALWDRPLSDDEIKALSAGLPPLFFPDGLVKWSAGVG